MGDEFSRIARYFAPLAGPEGRGLKDDAAVLAPRPGFELVLTVDQMLEGVHFLPHDPAGLVARKLLRRNLSDLAAMGAVPLGYLLTTALPRQVEEAWLAAFAEGLRHDQELFGFALFGGDSSSSLGPISLSATFIGEVTAGAALGRAGARAGDEIWVTGTIGDAALGLRARRGLLADDDGFLTSTVTAAGASDRAGAGRRRSCRDRCVGRAGAGSGASLRRFACGRDDRGGACAGLAAGRPIGRGDAGGAADRGR